MLSKGLKTTTGVQCPPPLMHPLNASFTLVAEGERFLCHRVVLQSASNYFKVRQKLWNVNVYEINII